MQTVRRIVFLHSILGAFGIDTSGIDASSTDSLEQFGSERIDYESYFNHELQRDLHSQKLSESESDSQIMLPSPDESAPRNAPRRKLWLATSDMYTVDGFPGTREFYVYVPSGITQPTGVVFFFHGYTLDVKETCAPLADTHRNNSFNVAAVAEERGFVGVCLQGNGLKPFAGWNNEICCGDHRDADDVGFVRATINKLRDEIFPALNLEFTWYKQVGADISSGKSGIAIPNVFAIGFSTGGLFSFRLACELSDELTGIAPVGATWNHAFGVKGTMTWATRCKNSVTLHEACDNGNGPLSVIQLIGNQDKVTSKSKAEGQFRLYAQDILDCNLSTADGAGLGWNSRTTVRSSSTTPALASGHSVECFEYGGATGDGAKCGGSETSGKGAKLCLYKPMGHIVVPMKTTFQYEAAAVAWEYLTARNLARGGTANGAVCSRPKSHTSSATTTSEKAALNSTFQYEAAAVTTNAAGGSSPESRVSCATTTKAEAALKWLFCLGIVLVT
eukprot:TRINITY_DN7401_c0_g1_i1.p1 TRINITY_DN7401_c0_g1~~TRINITY_DN7401_c0_g1_i1.p1  ORF type:complete len:504 (-),score=31.35 TRINITY_DN7401_c0_g1_i1:219-1730(-)